MVRYRTTLPGIGETMISSVVLFFFFFFFRLFFFRFFRSGEKVLRLTRYYFTT